MPLALIRGRTLVGLQAVPVTIEVHLANGLPGFSLVGLPQAEVRESRERVRAALIESGFEFPNRRITVNLAPADLPKTGGCFDLPIALGILLALGKLSAQQMQGLECVGELSLSGELKSVKGALALGLSWQSVPPERGVICPAGNAAELGRASQTLGKPLALLAATSLSELVTRLNADEQPTPPALPEDEIGDPNSPVLVDDIRGQASAKAALAVAAAGGHNMLLVGPPGSGKTMLASAMVGLLPRLNPQQALESAAITSLAGHVELSRWAQPAWRAPHHTASAAALVGGGSFAAPGEISLAHHGVLFLDELAEFSRYALDALRQPLESGTVSITRARYKARFPAQVQLIAAMNPCICGYFGSVRCRCSLESVTRYQAKVSGPLMDRIDLQLQVSALTSEELLGTGPPEAGRLQHENIKQAVSRARDRQLERQGCLNTRLTPRDTPQICALDEAGSRLLSKAFAQWGWSARGLHRVQRIARTIADLGDSPSIQVHHVAQALQWRRGLSIPPTSP